jgi:hypothetical protein
MAVRSRAIVGEGANPAGAAVNVLISRVPPRTGSQDYVQPVWLAWQGLNASTYRVWLSQQLPRLRNRARLEVTCDIEGLAGSRLRGTIRPTGQMWMLVVVPAFLMGLGLLMLTGLVAAAIHHPADAEGGLLFFTSWFAVLLLICRQLLVQLRRTYEMLLSELSAAIGGWVVPE